MPRKKLEINVDQVHIDELKRALKNGAPLVIALQYSGISQATYYYWVAMYSIVKDAKSQDDLEEYEAEKHGISIDAVKEMAATNSSSKKTDINAYIEPSAESMLQYRNDLRFKRFADQCYEIVSECNRMRAEAAMNHLITISLSTKDKRVNASGSMWFLERTLSDFFSKPSEKVREEELNKVPIEKVQVEFVDPGTKENKDRIKDMDELILNEQKDGLPA